MEKIAKTTAESILLDTFCQGSVTPVQENVVLLFLLIVLFSLQIIFNIPVCILQVHPWVMEYFFIIKLHFTLK